MNQPANLNNLLDAITLEAAHTLLGRSWKAGARKVTCSTVRDWRRRNFPSYATDMLARAARW